MGKMDIGGTAQQEMSIMKFDGWNSALAFHEIKETESLKMLNALPGSLGSLAKRPGSVPISDTLANPIKRVFSFVQNKSNTILATSNNTLYKLSSGTLTAQTGSLASSDVTNAQFKDEDGNDVVIIADGGNLKAYDGTEVYEITPAANDDDPLPANDLANINTNHAPIGAYVHGARVVIWDGSDTIWHSKVGYYDYFAQVDYNRWVNKGDYVQTVIGYRGALIVLLRNSIGVLFGQDIDNWTQDFLATQEGCMNPRTVQQVTYPDGRQEIFYLSDNGVYSIYTLDTVMIDNQSRYSTRSMTELQIDWDGLGVSKAEWQQATAHFHDNKYWLIYPKDGTWQGLVFDTTFGNWFPISNLDAHDFYNDEDYFMFASESGNLKELDKTLFSDWDDTDKTTGTPINTYWYSNFLTPKITGKDHLWDILIIEAKQHVAKSTVDVGFNTFNSATEIENLLKTQSTTWGQAIWGGSEWTPNNFTHFINYAEEVRMFKKGKYLQLKIGNDRDEPIEIYNITLRLRTMGSE